MYGPLSHIEVPTMTMQSLPVKQLRPTQIAVGRRLVKLKRAELRSFARKPQELVEFIVERPIRVVLGPMERAFIIDHHHLGLALLKEGYKTAPLQIEADFSKMAQRDFWPRMEERKWVHPFDGQGRRRPVTDVPKDLEDMADDPYRSLAGFVRVAGGFTKSLEPYAEFAWADYFRPLIKRGAIEKDFEKAVKKGVDFAHAAGASHLPGFVAKG
jgi:hypothetical protein